MALDPLPTWTDGSGTALDAANLNEYTTAIADLQGPFERMPTGWQFCGSPEAAGTNNALANGALRATAWRVTRATTVSGLAGEIYTAGDSTSKLRLGLYADSGNNYPGSLLVDAGQIAANATGVAGLTGLSQTLAPGLYWVAAAVQGVVTTQPTVVCVASTFQSPVPLYLGASLPAAVTLFNGYYTTGITGALPSTFSTGGLLLSASAPRLLANCS